MCVLRNAGKGVVGTQKIFLSNVRQCFLQRILNFRRFVSCQYAGFEIFLASLALPAHQCVGVTDAQLGGMEFGIDLQRCAVMLHGFFISAGHAENLSVRILRIRLVG